MIVIELPDEAATAALAAHLAALARVGDVIALSGDLGAGKTTFARAFIRARGGEEDVPSPTFTLVQQYELGGGTVWHFDGYRLRDPEEAWELGIEDAFADGISLVEWPDRFGRLLPGRRLALNLSTGARPTARRATIDPGDEPSGWRCRLAALNTAGCPDEPNVTSDDRAAAMALFRANAGWADVLPVPLAGDASFRRYFRLADCSRRAVLMDAPPPQEDVGPFMAVAAMLRGFGLSAPEIYAADRGCGFLLIEDFGDDSYTRLLADGADETALYTLAVDTLIALHRAVARGGLPALPLYDEARLLTEASLLPEWYAPSVLRGPLPERVHSEYLALWRTILPLAELPTATLVLRDYHVDNLMLLSDRFGVRACGLLDFQDAVIGPATYDLVSLLEDARRDVPGELRHAMTKRYLAAFPDLDPAHLARSAAIMAAQRNAKIIGLFVRLWRRDGKPAYLTHLPRVWRLFEDELAREPALAPIAGWLDRHLPRDVRDASPSLMTSAA